MKIPGRKHFKHIDDLNSKNSFLKGRLKIIPLRVNLPVLGGERWQLVAVNSSLFFSLKTVFQLKVLVQSINDSKILWMSSFAVWPLVKPSRVEEIPRST